MLQIILSFTLLASSAFAQPAGVPLKPDSDLTPGSVCASADEYRYSERIAYCNRAVKTITKDLIFERYNNRYHFTKNKFTRQSFKIDHYIPLCMGGSNDPSNLWPQHLTISEKTDKIEALLCELMSKGQLYQSEAIEMIKRAKANLQDTPEIERLLESRINRN